MGPLTRNSEMVAPEYFLIELFTGLVRTKEVQIAVLNEARNGIFAGLYQ